MRVSQIQGPSSQEAAGAFGVPRPAFLLLVTIGKMLRNWLLAILFAGTHDYFKG